MAVPTHPGAMLWAQIPYSLFCKALDGCNTVLDVGCGTGGNSIDMALEGKKVVGVDTSLPALNLANAKKNTLNFEREIFIENIKQLAFKDKDHFIGFDFLSEEEKKYYGLSPGDVENHDCYTSFLPLRRKLKGSVNFVCADAFDKSPINAQFDAVVCINILHMFERIQLEWMDSIVGKVKPGGRLLLAYVSRISRYPDFIGIENDDLSCYSFSGCRIADLLSDAGFECLDGLTCSLQESMDKHLCSFLYGNLPTWQRELQQSVYVGIKKR